MEYSRFFEGKQVLRPMGATAVFEFDCEDVQNKAYRLFVTGETGLFYQWKDEPDMPIQYRSISDALDSVHARNDRFCLDFSSGKPEEYIRRIYKKVTWPPVLSYLGMNPVACDWETGISVSTRNLQFSEGGYLRMRVEFFRKTDGIARRSRENPLLKSIILPIEAGSEGWNTLCEKLTLDPDTVAHVGVWIEGARYSGEVYLEAPFLTASSGENLLPAFDTSIPGEEQFDWTGQYLSRKEWPEFRVTLNGKIVFEGERFERCHRASEWEIELPGINKHNRLEISNISCYHDPLPYTIFEMGLLQREKAPLTLVAVSKISSLTGGAHLLVRTEKENTLLRISCGDISFEKLLQEKGLHGIKIDCTQIGENIPFTLTAENTIINGVLPRVIRREEDHVYTGTGDMIYVCQDYENIEEYLAWYVSHGIGNLLTVRPTYRWSGTRTLHKDAWQLFTRVLNELDMVYPIMVDGRELPGENTNPDNGMLAGRGFLGRQSHERDGAAYYWGVKKETRNPEAEQFRDMQKEIFREDPSHTGAGYAPENEYYVGDDLYLYRDPNTKRDYKCGHDAAVRFLAATRYDTTRHTGPSVLFNTLYEAGYRWVGAETMYGSMEPILAFERGASLAHGVGDIGVHHAVQWSSSPQDVPEHYKRYRLALYVSYMLGATEINTEEGLWHIEEYYSHFHRFSECCRSHLKQQQDFYRFVSSHSRTGRFHTPVALLQGRYDGWHAFGNHQVWGFADGENGDAEKSWQLLKAFYPLSQPGEALYCHGCSTDHEVGYYSGTPMGQIDVLPVDGGEALFENYGVLIFAGYHAAGHEDGVALRRYAENGGRVLLTMAHMSCETDYNKVFSGEFSFEKNPEARKATVNGRELSVATDLPEPSAMLASTDEGLPLVVRYDIGKGSVTLVTALAFPGNEAILPLYEKLAFELSHEEFSKETVWAETGDDVGFSVYKLPDDSTHIYFLAVDWYRAEEPLRHATLLVGSDRYPVELPFGVMLKVNVNGTLAAWAHSEEADVLHIEDGVFVLQGTGTQIFTLCKNGEQKDVTVDFQGRGIVRLTF